jgi:hypothetical protein
MKTAARRTPGRSAGEVLATIERFLKASRQPALLEPGEELLAIRADNIVLDSRNSRLTLQVWDERRNLVRRVLDVREEQRGRLELVAERFARKPTPLFLLDLAQAAGRDWERRGTRLVFRERFRYMLSREFAGWKISELTAEQDLEHSLSPAFPRALLRKGSSGLAAIAAPPGTIVTDRILSFGLIWLDYLRRRDRRVGIEGLLLFLPEGHERTTCLRLNWLNSRAARFEVFAYSTQDYAVRLDLRDFGNLDTHLDLCRTPSVFPRYTIVELRAITGVECVELSDGENSLRVRGLEFARTSGQEILFGLAERVRVRENAGEELGVLARELSRMRSANSQARGELYQRSPEAWLESQVRANLDTLDASLVANPVYGQVPAFAGGDRGLLDLLAVDRTGRLAIVELKASADLHLPLQALDYWMRVNWHVQRAEFSQHGYFPGLALRAEPPRLLLAGPALDFHPSTEIILRYFSADIEVERIGLAAGLRRTLQVMFRLRGYERPQ